MPSTKYCMITGIILKAKHIFILTILFILLIKFQVIYLKNNKIIVMNNDHIY